MKSLYSEKHTMRMVGRIQMETLVTGWSEAVSSWGGGMTKLMIGRWNMSSILRGK
jgi:hypothetical protein